jgi:hypothetical protein
MGDYRKLYDKDYLGSWDLDGKDATLVIQKVVGGELTANGGRKSKKPLVYFEGTKTGKALVLNATNGKTIAAMYGNDTDEWVGKKITIYPTVTQFGAETVECIRVRPGIPK